MDTFERMLRRQGIQPDGRDKFCPECEKKLEKNAERCYSCGWVSNKRPVCANCRSAYRKNDKYCRYCGAPHGTPIYIDDRFAMIYGPPFSVVHECKICGYTWENGGLGADTQMWCPECGGEAPRKAESKVRSLFNLRDDAVQELLDEIPDEEWEI